jgi:hypothetical protein
MLGHIWVDGESIIGPSVRFWISIEKARSIHQCAIFEGKR